MRLVIATCTVDYVGRLTAHLPSALDFADLSGADLRGADLTDATIFEPPHEACGDEETLWPDGFRPPGKC